MLGRVLLEAALAKAGLLEETRLLTNFEVRVDEQVRVAPLGECERRGATGRRSMSAAARVAAGRA